MQIADGWSARVRRSMRLEGAHDIRWVMPREGTSRRPEGTENSTTWPSDQACFAHDLTSQVFRARFLLTLWICNYGFAHYPSCRSQPSILLYPPPNFSKVRNQMESFASIAVVIRRTLKSTHSYLTSWMPETLESHVLILIHPEAGWHRVRSTILDVRNELSDTIKVPKHKMLKYWNG